jgi:hypothetical protein
MDRYPIPFTIVILSRECRVLKQLGVVCIWIFRVPYSSAIMCHIYITILHFSQYVECPVGAVIGNLFSRYLYSLRFAPCPICVGALVLLGLAVHSIRPGSRCRWRIVFLIRACGIHVFASIVLICCARPCGLRLLSTVLTDLADRTVSHHSAPLSTSRILSPTVNGTVSYVAAGTSNS